MMASCKMHSTRKPPWYGSLLPPAVWRWVSYCLAAGSWGSLCRESAGSLKLDTLGEPCLDRQKLRKQLLTKHATAFSTSTQARSNIRRTSTRDRMQMWCRPTGTELGVGFFGMQLLPYSYGTPLLLEPIVIIFDHVGYFDYVGFW